MSGAVVARWVGLVTALALATCPLVGATQTLSTRQMEALKPLAAARQVRRDLLATLRPVTAIDSGMFRRLHGVGLVTRPYTTEFYGLCGRDAVTLLYAPASLLERYEDQPVEPYGLEAQAWFHVVSWPQTVREDPGNRQVWSSECDRVERDADANWFTAGDAYQAVAGLHALKMARDLVGDGRLKVAPCPSAFDESLTCEQVFLKGAKLGQLCSVRRFELASGLFRYVARFGSNTEVTLSVRQKDEETDPAEVESVQISQYIVVT